MSIHKDIKKGNFAPIYLLYGAETFFIDETLNAIIDGAIDESEKEFNVSSYDLEETYLEEVLEDATTLPFLGERKVIVAKGSLFLTAQKTKMEQNTKMLEAYVQSPSPFTILVIIVPYEKLDERKKITKLLKKEATVIESNALSMENTRDWIINRVHENGCDIEERAVALLTELVGMNMMVLVNEVDKLTTFVGSGGRVLAENVQTLVPKSVEQNVFMLVEHVIGRRISEALLVLDELLYKQEEPIKILGLLATQFRLMYGVKEYMRKGYGQNQIASHLSIHPYRVKLAMPHVNSFSFEELYGIMDELAEADYMMKTGKLEKKLVLEFFIMKRNNR